MLTDFEKTKVYMYPLDEMQIKRYFRKISPFDKAGSFDVQGPGSIFIDRIEGCFYNVVGLPLAKKLIEARPRRVTMPGAGDLILRLHDRGYRLGIVSNNDGCTREKCREVGIEPFFSFILDSTLEGIMKPDPRIFARALEQAGAEPAEVLHVGDLYGCDILGARAAGIPAVWLGNDLIEPPPIPGVQRINSLPELLGLLP